MHFAYIPGLLVQSRLQMLGWHDRPGRGYGSLEQCPSFSHKDQYESQAHMTHSPLLSQQPWLHQTWSHGS